MNADAFITQMNDFYSMTTAEEIAALRWLEENNALTPEDEARLLELVLCYDN